MTSLSIFLAVGYHKGSVDGITMVFICSSLLIQLFCENTLYIITMVGLDVGM